MRVQRLDVFFDRQRGAFVALLDGEAEQLGRLDQTVGQTADAVDDALQTRALLAEVLRMLRVVPDRRALEFTRDFLQAFGLGVEVKDTP